MTSPEPKSALWRRILTPSLADVVFLAIFVLVITLGGALTNRDGDIGRHLTLGGSILDDGVIPTIDVYSHTMNGGEMIPHEWLSQTVFAAADRWAGFDGIGILIAVVAALPWMILYRYLTRRLGSVTIALGVVVLGASASAIHWATRPHAFTWIFVTIFVILLEDLRLGQRKQVWWVLPLMVLWANTHGAFIVGFLLIGTYLVGSAIEMKWQPQPQTKHVLKHLGLILPLAVLASMINPSGFETIVNGFAYVGEDFLTSFTNEYRSPDFHSILAWPFLAMLILSIALSFRWRASTLLLAVSWTAFALHSFRNIPLFAIIMTPILGQAMLDAVERSEKPHRFSNARLLSYRQQEMKAIGGALALLVGVVIGFQLVRVPGSTFGFDPARFPVEAMSQMEGDPPGDRVFNQFEWGGYLLYCCWPETLVFIDGQTDYYGEELTMEYEDAQTAQPNWESVLDKHEVDWALLPPDAPLTQVLSESDAWEEILRDETAVVFTAVAAPD